MRQANENETMTTLDNTERTLVNSDIVISNSKEPIALAGVMGGDFLKLQQQQQML